MLPFAQLPMGRMCCNNCRSGYPTTAHAAHRRPPRCRGTPGAPRLRCRSPPARSRMSRRRRSGRRTSPPARPGRRSTVPYVVPVSRDGARLRRVEDKVDPLVRRVALVGGRANLGVATEEREARGAVVGEVTAVARDARVRRFLSGRIVRSRLRVRHSLRVALILGVRRDERGDQLRRRERSPAVGRLQDHRGVGAAALGRELTERHVNMAVSGHGDVGELDVVNRGVSLIGLENVAPWSVERVK